MNATVHLHPAILEMKDATQIAVVTTRMEIAMQRTLYVHRGACTFLTDAEVAELRKKRGLKRRQGW